MKNNTKKLIALMLALMLAVSLTSCATANTEDKGSETPATSDKTTPSDGEKVPAEGVWAAATYRSDKSFGEGAKVIEVEVKAEDKSVTFTIRTNKDNLGDALLEHGLVDGEQGQYGLYIKSVNGISADYNTDKYYWALSKGGKDLMTGADGEKISGGEHYEIIRKK